jgi:hypothetical protein
MKKVILFLVLVLIVGIIAYFNQNRTKLYIMHNYDKKSKTHYYFCKNNRLCKVVSHGVVVSYTIDKNGNRSEKFIDAKPLEKYYWIGNEKLNSVSDKNGNILREYLYKGKYSNLPFGMIENGKKYYFIYNKMRTLRVITDEYHNIVKVLYYDKNAKIIKDTNPRIKVDFAYAGGLWDKDAKVLFFQEGVYDPLVSMWISKVKKRDIIKNLKELSALKKDDVYICSATLDTFYHSYICAQNSCGGLYASKYLRYFDAKGYILDNSVYFNDKSCKKLKLSKHIDKKRFAKCVYERIIPREGKYFDVFKHNCHDEVKDIIKTCTKKALKETL